jgi:dolichyl-phosphate-mannose--protein O-mannosyl transferase
MSDFQASSTPLGNVDAFFLFLIMMVSFGIRYWRIALPANVVFDEVYFGNFSNFYIHSQFFHDVHPPLGKIIMAIIANLSEYDGSINFHNCPTGYPIPDYVQLRITPATFSALCYPLLYLSMRFMNFGYISSLTGTICALFDTSMATEGRHILSDGLLHFFTCFHICVLSFTLSIPARRRRFWRWHVLTGITLGCACSCKNTAWGLIAFDAGCYSFVLSDCLVFGFFEYFIELLCFGLPLGMLCLSTYFAIFSLHFVLLPYSGPDDRYLQESMRTQLVPKSAAGLFARRLRGPGLFVRGFILSLQMHRGNMGIQQFHDSQSFPRHWPVLGSISVFFWSQGSREIRCFGNAIVYYCALLGIAAMPFAFRRSNCIKIALGYAFCYFPFYLIPRVLYLYHYIIPLMFGCMAFGAALEIYIPVRFRGVVFVAAVAAAGFGYWLWSPYVYGTQMHDRAIMDWSRNWIDGDLEHRSRRASKNAAEKHQ